MGAGTADCDGERGGGKEDDDGDGGRFAEIAAGSMGSGRGGQSSFLRQRHGCGQSDRGERKRREEERGGEERERVHLVMLSWVEEEGEQDGARSVLGKARVLGSMLAAAFGAQRRRQVGAAARSLHAALKGEEGFWARVF